MIWAISQWKEAWNTIYIVQFMLLFIQNIAFL